MAAAWNRSTVISNPLLRLHTKLQRTRKALRRWSRGLLGANKILLRAADQLIGILDAVQDYRALSASEIQLKKDLKVRLLGLTVVDKLRARQASRLVSIRASEANSKLFFLRANGRRRKNFISSIQTEQGMVYSHESKADKLFEHYSNHFGPKEGRELTLNWEHIGMQRHDLTHLEEVFTEEEVLATIRDIASEKAPGPDGFIGLFFKTCWLIIKQDLMAAFDFFYN